MTKLNYQKLKDRDRGRQAWVDEIREIMATPPPALQETVHLKIKCKKCRRRADLILSQARLMRGVTVRCSQCGTKQEI